MTATAPSAGWLAKSAALIAVLTVAAGLRFAYGLARPPQARGAALYDPDGYVELAHSVARHGGLYEEGRPSAHREPAYPVFLGAWFRIVGSSYGSFLFSNVLLGCVGLAWVSVVGAKLFDRTIGLEAAALAAAYPPFIFYAAQPMRETAMLATSGLALWAVIEADQRRSYWASAGAGASCALACLTNTTFLPFSLLVPAGLLVWRADGADYRRSMRCTLAFLGLFASLYSLWPLRNYRAFGEWVAGSTAGAGSTFYLYLNIPEEFGGTPKQQEMMDRDPVHARCAARPTQLQRERCFWRAGIDWVRAHPVEYARLVAWRFLDSWRLAPRPRAYAHSYGLVKWISYLTDGWIIPIGLLGMAWTFLRSRQTRWAVLFVLSVNTAYALVFTMIRYRFSLMPWIILFAVAAIERMRRGPEPTRA
ncbi:MAG: glycosyltransferase family 39 protein [Elusimicrobia bacterium]|nr:glycosyltransferase family 39 protein [Elusimicrobiota bacterium]